ncbi:MAG: phage tail protein [Peptococcaceae bacterium]|nr:phage tail protein [Peptococcaceae bacterium]MDH7525285.1 phage tail protein [Peptococcaceae bacterium]
MAKSEIYLDTKQIDRLTIELKGFEKEVGTATKNALNRAIDHIIAKTGQLVSKVYSIKSGDVKKSFANIKRPSNSDLSASITSKGHLLSLGRFPHSPAVPIKNIKRSKRQVKVQIKKTGGKKPVRTDPKAFIAPTGARSADKMRHNVFKRVGNSRLPIQIIRTLSVPQMITNEKIAEQILEAGNKVLRERLEHEITREIFNIGRKVKGR